MTTNPQSLLVNPLQLGSAVFSDCQKYRYVLWRRWSEDWHLNYALFVGLNPSTADEVTDDPTLRRCVGFAKDWGYSGVCMVNLFGYRATDPKEMLAAPDPIGAENDRYLVDQASNAAIVIAAWGNYGTFGDRHLHVKQLLPVMHCLKVTKAGLPSHPLYLPKTLKPFLFKP